MFLRNVGYLPASPHDPSSSLKMEAGCFSKTLVSTYKSTRRHNPEEQHRTGLDVVHLILHAFTLSDIRHSDVERRVTKNRLLFTGNCNDDVLMGCY
jgi:hypothetical protein